MEIDSPGLQLADRELHQTGFQTHGSKLASFENLAVQLEEEEQEGTVN